MAWNPATGRANLTHCYGMVGVGRDMAPDTGMGGELYAVIGHAPRHLDRNIALVGRVVEGIEQMSALPRGTEALGIYKTGTVARMIASVRLASAMPAAERPRFQAMNTASATFSSYVRARANRKDAFFNIPAGGVDLCNAPVPVRRTPALSPRVSRPRSTARAITTAPFVTPRGRLVTPPRRVLDCGCGAE